MAQVEDDLPDRPMDYIADMLGRSFADRLSVAAGGLDRSFPGHVKSLTDDHWLVQALGRDDAEELVGTLGAAVFYVPRQKERTLTARAVLASLSAGQTAKQIAEELGISARHVRRLARAHRERAAQVSAGPTEDQRAACLDLHMWGESIKAIAAALDLPRDEVAGILTDADRRQARAAMMLDQQKTTLDCCAAWKDGQSVEQIAGRLNLPVTAVQLLLARTYGSLSDARWAQHMATRATPAPADASPAQIDAGLTGGNAPSGHSPT